MKLICQLALALIVLPIAVDSTSLRATAQSSLRRTATQRVELIAQSKVALDSLAAIPKNVTKAKEVAVLSSLEDQVKKLEGNVQAITKMDKAEHSTDAEKKSKELRSHMKGADQAMLDKMDSWGSRMNRKTRLGAMDVISKLKNAIHLVKKGALSGNKDAADSLNNVLSKMGAMAGQPTGGNFLH